MCQAMLLLHSNSITQEQNQRSRKDTHNKVDGYD